MDIKDRIRKLMAYANDAAASEGEIENAMRHAQALIDKHQIDAAELMGTEGSQPVSFGSASAGTTSSRTTQWETLLAWAVCELYGTVRFYISHKSIPARKNGIVQVDRQGNAKMVRVFEFYGPLEDARDAGSLFTEWAHLIASMGVIKWGGAYRGDGALYCLGFARAVYDKVAVAGKQRIEHKTTTAGLIGGSSTAIVSLAGRNELIRKQSRDWLKSAGINLKKGGGGGGGGYTGSAGAYQSGASDGGRAGFAKKGRVGGYLN